MSNVNVNTEGTIYLTPPHTDSDTHTVYDQFDSYCFKVKFGSNLQYLPVKYKEFIYYSDFINAGKQINFKF